MDLRNLAAIPGQYDPVQRRPSVLSLLSASGYASSAYSGAPPQLSNQRINQARAGQTRTDIANAGAAGAIGTPWLASMNNVAPWVEQQAQQAKDGGVGPEDKPKARGRGHGGAGTPGGAAAAAGAGSSDEADSDDELIPTAIVIKNIPFAIKKEQLLDVMTKLGLPLPYAFNYHFDNGVFRGLAFANFTLTNETSQVVNLLNGREIGGRKLRVEYKKMLPLLERERIEREKREKRGQLEEQHRSTSNALLTSMLSAALTTAATKNASVGERPERPERTERAFAVFPAPPGSLAESAAPPPPPELNLNEPDVLDVYTQLVVFRDDPTRAVFELAFLASLAPYQRKVLSSLAAFLNLLEFYDNGLVLIRRKPGQAARPMSLQPPSHLSSMVNLGQWQAPDVLRSPLAVALSLALPRLAATPQPAAPPQHSAGATAVAAGAAAAAPAAPTAPTAAYPYPYRPGYAWQHSPQPHQPQPQPQALTPTSAAALLRSGSNRSFVDVHASFELPTPQQTNYFGPPSQPGTPLAGSDINLRFAPFAGNYGDDYEMHHKFNGMKLGSSGSTSCLPAAGAPALGAPGIWGPK